MFSNFLNSVLNQPAASIPSLSVAPKPADETAAAVSDEGILLPTLDEQLREAMAELQEMGGSVQGSLSRQVELLSTINHALVTSSGKDDLKSVFTEIGGFVVLVSTIGSLAPSAPSAPTTTSKHSNSSISHEPVSPGTVTPNREGPSSSSSMFVIPELVPPSEEEIKLRVEALRLIFGCLVCAMSGFGNVGRRGRQYFDQMISFPTLLETLRLSGLLRYPTTHSLLLAFAFGDFAPLSESLWANFFSATPSSQTEFEAKISLLEKEEKLGYLVFPQCLSILVQVRLFEDDLDEDVDMIGTAALLLLLEKITSRSTRNLILITKEEGILSGLVRLCFPDSNNVSTPPPTPLRTAMLKLLRRLLEFGCSPLEARNLFSLALTPGRPPSLNSEVLSLLKHAMKSRQPPLFNLSLAPSSIYFPSLPAVPFIQKSSSAGWSFLSWVNVSQIDLLMDLELLTMEAEGKVLMKLGVSSNGNIFVSGSGPAKTLVGDVVLPLSRWVLIGLVCRKGKGSSLGEVSLILDGRSCQTLKYPYPPTLSSITTRISARLGGTNLSPSPAKNHTHLSISSTYIFSQPVAEDFFLLAHHLGPRYSGNFQVNLGGFLTYEGSTSLNIFLSSAQGGGRAGVESLVKGIKDGGVIEESDILLSLSAEHVIRSTTMMPLPPVTTGEEEVEWVALNGAIPKLQQARRLKEGLGILRGEIVAVEGRRSMDESVWGVGGSAVLLKLVEAAMTKEELRDTQILFVEAVRENWRNSEDMERSHGYEILAHLLRSKMSKLMTVEGLKAIMGSLGVNIDKPDIATISNSTGYRYIALDFELWSKAPKDVQKAHLQHFRCLMESSKFKRFNIRQRLFKKMSLMRKLLFALRAGFYQDEMVPFLVQTIRLAAHQHFSTEDTIKPLVAYLVSSLCGTMSTSDNTDFDRPVDSGLLVLNMLADLLHNPAHLTKFHSALPIHRILLLLLSNTPSPSVTLPTMDIIAQFTSATFGDSFSKKFDQEGGFQLLTKILPVIWGPAVHVASFRILTGSVEIDSQPQTVVCSYIFPAVLEVLEHGLKAAGDRAVGSDNDEHHGSQSENSQNDEDSGEVISLPPPADSLFSDMAHIFATITGLFVSSPSFSKLVTSKRLILDSIVKASADYLAKSASTTVYRTPELTAEVQNLRDSILQSLRIFSKARISSSVKLEISKLLPAALDTDRNFSTSPIISNLHKRISLSRRNTGESFASIDSMESSMSISRSLELRPTMALLKPPSEDTRFQSSKDRNAAWRQIILSVESSRFAKASQEAKNHSRKVEIIEWPKLQMSLEQERGLYPSDVPPADWRLDGSEGPLRQRLRLERAIPDAADGSSSFYPKRSAKKDRAAVPEADELLSATSTKNRPPWEDPFALGDESRPPAAKQDGTAVNGASRSVDSATEEEEEEEIPHNPHHLRVVESLERGEVIEEIHNTVRIVGVDACPGLLVLTKKNIYLIDGLAQDPSGDIVDSDVAEKDVFSIPSGTTAQVDSKERECHHWSYADVVEITKRAFLFRDVGLELYFKDSRNFLLVFPTKKNRETIASRLINRNDSPSNKGVIGDFLTNNLTNKIASRVTGILSGLKLPELDDATNRWVHRQISTFAYLVIINQVAGRTPNDVTQYPVFPWVVKNYTSPNLILNLKSTFRDLAVPMGALTQARKAAAAERYENVELAGEKPFHYGTHFSSSMIVAGFLIRQSPFTEMFLSLQGGTFDLADRLFSSVPRAWESACGENRGDVRELIPQFYSGFGDFLLNQNHHEFGFRQSGGEVDHVELPPWAHDDPLLFVTKMREALESDYVSLHLPAWLDLIFGIHQRSVTHLNVFHPLSYIGSVDLDKIIDPNERAATVGIIHNFGQTPKKVFTEMHPRRIVSGKMTLPFGVRFGIAENYSLIIQSAAPIHGIKFPVYGILPHTVTSRFQPWPDQRIPVPNRGQSVEWGFSGGGFRIYSDARRLVNTTEWTDVTCAAFIDDKTLISGSRAGVLSLWRFASTDSSSLTQFDSLRTHEDGVICIHVSKAWSIFLSGSKDGSVCIWDINRLRYIRTIWGDEMGPIHLTTVNEASGYIATASHSTLSLYTLNGTFISSVLTAHPTDAIKSMAFFEREWTTHQIIATGHTKGKIILWQLTAENTPDGEKAHWRLETLRVLHYKAGSGHEGCEVTSLKFSGERLYSGDSGGNLYLWALPEGGAENVPDTHSTTCMNGNHTSFSILEQKRYCGGCGGVFCGACCQSLSKFELRYCPPCRVALALGSMGEVDHNLDLESQFIDDDNRSRRSSIVTLTGADLPRHRGASPNPTHLREALERSSRSPSRRRSLSRDTSSSPRSSTPNRSHPRSRRESLTPQE